MDTWAGLGALALAAGLTVVIEVAVLALAGYRASRFIVVCVLVNIATNLTLNAALSMAGTWRPGVVYPAEVAVVVVEWAVLAQVADHGASLPWRSRASARLLAFVFLANVASFLAGFLL